MPFRESWVCEPVFDGSFRAKMSRRYCKFANLLWYCGPVVVVVRGVSLLAQETARIRMPALPPYMAWLVHASTARVLDTHLFLCIAPVGLDHVPCPAYSCLCLVAWLTGSRQPQDDTWHKEGSPGRTARPVPRSHSRDECNHSCIIALPSFCFVLMTKVRHNSRSSCVASLVVCCI